MRVAVYVRVSTQRQAQAQTIEQQLERLCAHIHAQGWQLAPEAIFRDDGYSGAQLARPGLDRLRDRVGRAEVDRVLSRLRIGWPANMSIKCCCPKSSNATAVRSSFWTGP